MHALEERATLTQNKTAETMATIPGFGPGATMRAEVEGEKGAFIKTSCFAAGRRCRNASLDISLLYVMINHIIDYFCL